MRVSPILYLDLETQLSAADVGGWEHAEAKCASRWHVRSTR